MTRIFHMMWKLTEDIMALRSVLEMGGQQSRRSVLTVQVGGTSCMGPKFHSALPACKAAFSAPDEWLKAQLQQREMELET